jgi:hypothetical protein
MHGNVSFIELGTSDTERSRPFFQRVFGWTFTPMAQGGGWFQAPSMRVGFHGEHWFERPEAKLIPRLRRSLGSVECPFAVTRKAYALAFINNPLREVRATDVRVQK